ncbi:MAG: site-specific integrase [Bacteroidales bacterium]|nr:site-specific integrase [Bacteroidales bacterium]
MKQKRPNGMGTLFKRGNMWWGGILYHGTLHRMSLGVHVSDDGTKTSDLKAKALKKLAGMTSMYRLETESDTLTLIKAKIEGLKEELSRGPTTSITMAEIYDAFVKSKRRREIECKRLEQYKSLCDDLVKFKGPTFQVSRFTNHDAEEFVRIMDDVNGNAPSTINLKLAGLGYLWKILSFSFDVKHNPWESIPKRKTDIKSHNTFSDEQIKMIKEKAGDNFGGDLKRLIIIGANTGMRIGDCCTLKWEHVDFINGFVRKKTRKTGALISVPLLEELRSDLECLKNSISGEPEGFILPSMQEAYSQNSDIPSKRFIHLLTKCGIESSTKVGSSKRRRQVLGFHSFRHTAATRFVEAGVPLEIVRSVLGHATDNMTRHYTHVREQAIRDAFDKAGIR